jgi:hypothetical protein
MSTATQMNETHLAPVTLNARVRQLVPGDYLLGSEDNPLVKISRVMRTARDGMVVIEGKFIHGRNRGKAFHKIAGGNTLARIARWI